MRHMQRGRCPEGGRKAYPDLVKRYNDDGERITKTAAAKPRSISKAVQDFEIAVDEIVKRDGINRSAAMSKARTEHPDTFAAYQNA